eukprot:4242813-Pyramimonas_sp.AAC.1
MRRGFGDANVVYIARDRGFGARLWRILRGVVASEARVQRNLQRIIASGARVSRILTCPTPPRFFCC